MHLNQLGWNSYFETQFEKRKDEGFFPARVIAEFKNLYRIEWEKGEVEAQVSGKMMFDGISRNDYPAVGDWVVVEFPKQGVRGVIHAVLPRKSQFIRKMAGSKKDIQIVASNIDFVFIVNALDHDFNLRRIERYLTMSWESGATPVIILNKADQCKNVEDFVEKTETISMGTSIHAISCHSGFGFEEINRYNRDGQTIALLGSSGVGKSSIINRLLGETQQKTNALRVRDNGGKHTTTSRELFHIPGGGLIIDTPGMRELRLYGSENVLEGSFEDIESLTLFCKFSNCQHTSEPGCAVQEAIENGTIDKSRLESYKKLQRELRYTAQKNNIQNNDKKQKLKMISKYRKQLTSFLPEIKQQKHSVKFLQKKLNNHS